MENYVIWFTGISNSGKTTLAKKLNEYLDKQNIRYEYIDGDEVRNFFEGDLGYTRAERVINVRRIAFAAYVLAKNGILTIVANIAPYYEVRDFIRRKINKYIQIYLKADVDSCASRDFKDIYDKDLSNQTKNVIGVDDPYEVPRNPDIVIDTCNKTEDESIEIIFNYLKERKII